MKDFSRIGHDLGNALPSQFGMMLGLASAGTTIAYGVLRLVTRMNVILNLYVLLFGVLMGASEIQILLVKRPLSQREGVVRFACWLFVASLCVNDGQIVGFVAGGLTATRAATLWPWSARRLEASDDEEARSALTGSVGPIAPLELDSV